MRKAAPNPPAASEASTGGGRRIHPLVEHLSARVWISPKGEVAIDARAARTVEAELTRLAAAADEAFFEPYRQVLNLALALHETHPESIVPAELLLMLDGVAALALPKFDAVDDRAREAWVDDVGRRFRTFTEGLS